MGDECTQIVGARKLFAGEAVVRTLRLCSHAPILGPGNEPVVLFEVKVDDDTFDMKQGDLLEFLSGSVNLLGQTGSVKIRLETKFTAGTGAPTSTVASDGDLYLDVATGDVYELQLGVWVLVGSLGGGGGSAVTCVQAVVSTALPADGVLVYASLEDALLAGHQSICVRDGSHYETGLDLAGFGTGVSLKIMAPADVTASFINVGATLDLQGPGIFDADGLTVTDGGAVRLRGSLELLGMGVYDSHVTLDGVRGDPASTEVFVANALDVRVEASTMEVLQLTSAGGPTTLSIRGSLVDRTFNLSGPVVRAEAFDSTLNSMTFLTQPSDGVRVVGCTVRTALTFNAGAQNVAVTGCELGTLAVPGGSLADATLTGNQIKLATTVGTPWSRVVFADNVVQAALSLGDLSDCALQGNTVSGTVTVTGLVETTAVTGNRCLGFAFDDEVSSSTLSGNRVDNDVVFSATARDCAVANNAVGNDLAFQTLLRSSVLGNAVEGAVAVQTAVNESSVVGNTMDAFVSTTTTETLLRGNQFRTGGLLLIGSAAAADMAGVVVAENRSTAGLTVGGPCERLWVTGNVFSGPIQFQDAAAQVTVAQNTATGPGVGGGPALFFGGAVTQATVAQNDLRGTSQPTLHFQAAATEVVVSENRVQDQLQVGGFATDVQLLGNDLQTTGGNALVLAGGLRVTLAHNRMGGSALAGLADSTVAANVVTGTMSAGALATCAVTGNAFAAGLNAITVTDTAVVGNRFLSNVNTTDVTDTVFADNVCQQQVFVAGAATRVAVTNNLLGGKLEITGALQASTVSGNTSEGELVVGDQVTNATVANNVFTKPGGDAIEFKLADPEGLTLSGNQVLSGHIRFNGVGAVRSRIAGNRLVVGSLLVEGTLALCTVHENKCSNDIAVTTACNTTTVSGNNCNSITVGAATSHSAFTGNRLQFDLELTGSVTDTVVSSNTSIGNLDVGTTNVDDCVVSDNKASGRIRLSDLAGTITRLSVTGNVVGGDVDFMPNGASAITRLSVTGNTANALTSVNLAVAPNGTAVVGNNVAVAIGGGLGTIVAIGLNGV